MALRYDPAAARTLEATHSTSDIVAPRTAPSGHGGAMQEMGAPCGSA
jgi:hypothetical protein